MQEVYSIDMPAIPQTICPSGEVVSAYQVMLSEIDGQIKDIQKDLALLEQNRAALEGGINALRHIKARIENGLVALDGTRVGQPTG